MKNAILILFLVISVISCSKSKFRIDKIQFSDRQSLSDKKATSSLVSEIFRQDTLLIKYYNIGCNYYLKANIKVVKIDDSIKVTCDTVDTHTVSQEQLFFTYIPEEGINFYLNKSQLDSIHELFNKYANREYKMHSTSNHIYELIGSDTSITVENNYYYDGNPLYQFQELLSIKKIKELAQARSADTSASDIYWSNF